MTLSPGRTRTQLRGQLRLERQRAAGYFASLRCRLRRCRPRRRAASEMLPETPTSTRLMCSHSARASDSGSPAGGAASLAVAASERAQDLVGVGGLGQVVHGAEPHGFDRGGDAAVAGQHHDARGRILREQRRARTSSPDSSPMRRSTTAYSGASSANAARFVRDAAPCARNPRSRRHAPGARAARRRPRRPAAWGLTAGSAIGPGSLRAERAGRPCDRLSQAAGSTKLARVPRPGCDDSSSRPPICSATLCARNKPSPMPWPRGLVVKNGSVARASTASGMPGPSSSHAEGTARLGLCATSSRTGAVGCRSRRRRC